MTDVKIQRRSMAGSLEYVAARLEAAVEDGTEATLRTVASQVVFSLRMLAAEPEPPKPGPRVMNRYTGQWVLVPAEDLTEFLDGPEAYAQRAQERFRDEWNAKRPGGTHA